MKSLLSVPISLPSVVHLTFIISAFDGSILVIILMGLFVYGLLCRRDFYSGHLDFLNWLIH